VRRFETYRPGDPGILQKHNRTEKES
jgi:hypothetical protein